MRKLRHRDVPQPLELGFGPWQSRSWSSCSQLHFYVSSGFTCRLSQTLFKLCRPDVLWAETEPDWLTGSWEAGSWPLLYSSCIGRSPGDSDEHLSARTGSKHRYTFFPTLDWGALSLYRILSQPVYTGTIWGTAVYIFTDERVELGRM